MNNIPWAYRIYRLAWSGVDLLFPPVCGGCGKTGSSWCLDCQSWVPVIVGPFCDRCGISVSGGNVCERCVSKPPVYRKMRSWAVFDSPVQNALHTLKYRRNMGVADALATQVAAFVRSLTWDVDMLVPVPPSAKRLKERGYNHVGLVARPLAYELDLPYIPLGLRKIRETRSQVGLNISQRNENVLGAYQAEVRLVNRKSILLMDDVATTGSTIHSSANALLVAGARDVYALTIVRALSYHDMARV